MEKNKLKLGLGILTVLATPIAVSELTSSEVQAEYRNSVFYYNNKPANWWHMADGEWYYFKNGKKHTGIGQDSKGIFYYVNGKYANGNHNGKTYVEGKEVAQSLPREEKVVRNAYSNGIFYEGNGKPANWWHMADGEWYYFKNGKKHTGIGQDSKGTFYYVNGKYANGNHNGKTYVEGKEVAQSLPREEKVVRNAYSNGIFYEGNGKPANWWHMADGEWYYFKNGKKHTGIGQDSKGTFYYVNGKYANGNHNGKTYVEGKEVAQSLPREEKVVRNAYSNGIFYEGNGKPANWWHMADGEWYYFKNGKKHTGIGQDSKGTFYYVNGKYANGQYNGKNYVGGKEMEVNAYSGYYKVASLYIPVYDASGNILSHVSKDTILFRDNRASVGGRIPVQVAGLTGYVNPSQVQAVNSSTTFIPDYVSDGKYVYHRYSQYSKVIVAYHNANMVVGKSYYSADGVNFGTFKLDHPFQFSNLKSKTNYTAADLNRLYSLMGANDSRLAGKGATFKAAEERYGVNALYLVAHSALESAWGRSKIARDKNNFFGISAYDNNPYNSATKFDDVDSGILGAARWINEKYLSKSTYPARGAYLGNKAGGMNVNYATAPYWGESIASIMFAANEKLGRKDR